MPIPAFDELGLLPVGVHDCTIDEIKVRLGSFQSSERRPQLLRRLAAFANEAKSSGVVHSIIVNGSFATAKPEPNDIDLIVVVWAEHDFSGDLNPLAYNVLSKRSVQRRFGFDMLVAREHSVEYERWTAFFQQVRLEPER